MKRIHPFLFFCVFFFSSTFAHNPFYPKVKDDHWTYSSFSNGKLNNAYAPVDDGQGGGTNKKVFYCLELRGLKVNGQYILKENLQHNLSLTSTSSTKRTFSSFYSITGTSSSLSFYIYLNKDGSWKIQATIGGSSTPVEEVYIRADYDLNGSSNDIVESIFNEGGKYYAESTEYTDFSNFTEYDSDEIKRNIVARIFDGKVPSEQFGSIIYTVGGTNINTTFKKYSSDKNNLPPENYYSSGTTLQTTHNPSNLNRYAYSGKDQLVWFTLKKNSGNEANYYIGGQTFQRPSGRAFILVNNVMSGAQTPSITSEISNGRSALDLIEDLNDQNISHTEYIFTKTGLSNSYGSSMTMAQIEAFSEAARDDGSPNLYGSSYRNNFSLYLIENNIVDATFSDAPSALGLSNERGINAVFWKRVEQLFSSSSDRAKQLNSSIVHEIGHGFGVSHSWVGNTQMAAGTFKDRTAYWDSKVLDYYKHAPESWIAQNRWAHSLKGQFLTAVPYYYGFEGNHYGY